MNQIADIIIYSNHKYIMDRGIPYRQPSSYKVGNFVNSNLQATCSVLFRATKQVGGTFYRSSRGSLK